MKRGATKIACVVIVSLLCAGPGTGQETENKLKSAVQSLTFEIVAAKKAGMSGGDLELAVRQGLSIGQKGQFYSDALVAIAEEKAKGLAPARKDFVRAAEEARLDKENGGDAQNSASTSLLSRASIPSILGFAVENGALEKSEDGTTVTFRGNPVGIFQVLQDKGFVTGYDSEAKETRFFRKFSFAFSFDTSRGGGAGTLTADAQQLSSWGLRWDVVNLRDPRGERYKSQWENLIKSHGEALTKSLNNLVAKLRQTPAFTTWQRELVAKVMAASGDEVETVVESELRELYRKLTENGGAGGELALLVDNYRDTLQGYLQSREKLFKDIKGALAVSFEYTNLRKVNEEDRSNFRLVAGGRLWNGQAEMTANASFTMLNKVPAGSGLKRWRDVQVSGQLDVALSSLKNPVGMVLTFAGKYERLLDNVQDPMGAVMADTKGGIGYFQTKLTLPIKGSGLKIPISVTFANRTELIKEREVRGSFGITLDVDTLFALFRP